MAELPVWQPAGEVPAPEPRGDGSGRVLALLATEEAVSQGWGPAVAAGLAYRWAAEGHRVALVDAGLDRPSLHDVLGVANREGLTDAALHGASLERVATPISGGRFLFVSAGTAVADGGAVVQSPRWYRITDGMLEAGVTLLVYLRHGGGAATAFLGAASDVVLLAGAGSGGGDISPDLVPIVRAVTGGSDAADALATLAAAAAADQDAPSSGDGAVDVAGAEGGPATPEDDPAKYAADASAMGGFGGGGADMPAWAQPPADGVADGGLDFEAAAPPAGDVAAEVGSPEDDLAGFGTPGAADALDFDDPVDDVLAGVGSEAGDADGSGAAAAGVRVAPDKGSGGGVTTLLFVLLVIAVATALGWMLSSGAG